MVHEVDLTGVTISHFELIEKIGSGGMGTVYMAKDTQSGKDVAVKVLPPRLEDTPERLDHFLEEAHVSIQLDHPNITKGLEVGEYEGVYYFAKEYIKGWNLEEALKENGAFREDAIIQIGLQMALALEESDKAGLVHKDIKPSNILMTMNNVAYITDFGLASFTRIPEHEGEKDLLVAGTPHYMSPEQAGGHTDLDIRSDIYSLGVTLYELATGEIPYRAETTREVMGQHLFAPVADPRNINSDVSDKLSAVVMKMMAKDREGRYSSPAELQKEFYNLIQGKELIAEKEAREREKDEQGGQTGLFFIAYIKKAGAKLLPRRVADSLGSFKAIMLLMALAIIGLTVAVIILTSKTFSGKSTSPDTADTGLENGMRICEKMGTLPAAAGRPSGNPVIHYTFENDFKRSVIRGRKISAQSSVFARTVPVSEETSHISVVELCLDCELQTSPAYLIWLTFKAEQDGVITLKAETESGTAYIYAGYIRESVILRQVRLQTDLFKKSSDRSVDLGDINAPAKLSRLKIFFTAGREDNIRNRLLISEFALIREE